MCTVGMSKLKKEQEHNCDGTLIILHKYRRSKSETQTSYTHVCGSGVHLITKVLFGSVTYSIHPTE